MDAGVRKMDVIKNWIQNNCLMNPDDIDALLDTADLTRQLIHEKNYTGINTVINFTIENSLHEAFTWIMELLEEEFEKKDGYELEDFACNIGRSIADFDEFSDRLQVDYNVQQNSVESVYDEHGEVESFFNNFIYKTKYGHIYLISSENFDTKDNDYIQYKLLFSRQPEGVYTVHVQSVPDGYAEDAAE